LCGCKRASIIWRHARERAALTETCLSLRKERAATDVHRAIMLGVIFRPVADCMVKEDGSSVLFISERCVELRVSPVRRMISETYGTCHYEQLQSEQRLSLASSH